MLEGGCWVCNVMLEHSFGGEAARSTTNPRSSFSLLPQPEPLTPCGRAWTQASSASIQSSPGAWSLPPTGLFSWVEGRRQPGTWGFGAWDICRRYACRALLHTLHRARALQSQVATRDPTGVRTLDGTWLARIHWATP